MQLIPPDTHVDFMKASRVAATISGVMVLLSVIAVAFLGLNLGIDFKGGTKIIAAFAVKDGAKAGGIDREQIREVIRGLAEQQLGTRDVQVEVQDFYSGAVGEEGIHRFQVLTELTSFMGEKRREALITDIKADFGDNLRNLNVVREGEDKFYIYLNKKRSIPKTVAKIKETFAKHGLKQIAVASSLSRALDVDFYRDLDLRLKEGADDLTVAQEVEAHNLHKDKLLAKRTDEEFQVRVEELKGFIDQAFKKSFPDTFKEVESFTSISASVGRQLLNSGLLAVFYAIIGILIYIWLRFDIRYSPGAVIALIHDVMITLGIFALTRVKFTLPIIAALLTIVGYSLNDTIVVYDRIRETLSRVHGKDLVATVNESVNATLSRTLLTSLTTLVVVLCLLFLGGGLIRNFAFAMTIGILVGTYSSIYVASPVVVLMDRMLQARRAEQQGGSVNKARTAVTR